MENDSYISYKQIEPRIPVQTSRIWYSGLTIRSRLSKTKIQIAEAGDCRSICLYEKFQASQAIQPVCLQQ